MMMMLFQVSQILICSMAVSAFPVFGKIRLHSVGSLVIDHDVDVFHRQATFLYEATTTVSSNSYYNDTVSCVNNNDSTTSHQIVKDITTPDASKFWGQRRSKQEIEDFCYQAVFNQRSSLSTSTPPSAIAAATNRVTVLNAEPTLVIMHDFLSHDQCDALIQAAIHQQLQRSTIGNTQETTDIRTSTTTWLRDEEDTCSSNSSCSSSSSSVRAATTTTNKRQALRSFARRVSRLSGLPPENMENVQIVHYVETQKFDIHTDHLDAFNDLEVRGRLATCLVYLSDSHNGGETHFPEFDVSVKATKGSALFFWNTLERPGMKNYDPQMFLNVDVRLRHAGLPVTGGVKWACNRWIHPVNFGAGVSGV